MRVALALLALLTVAACSSLPRMVRDADRNGVGYDIRPTTLSTGQSVYEVIIVFGNYAYRDERLRQGQHCGALRARHDGFSYAVVEGPLRRGSIVETTMRGYAVTGRRELGTEMFLLYVFKGDQPRPPEARSVDTIVSETTPNLLIAPPPCP
jgi:hypothetical protein